MCYETSITFSCGHSEDTGNKKCPFFADTDDWCDDLHAKSTRDPKLCNSCDIEQEAKFVTIDDLDERAQQVIDTIRAEFELRDPNARQVRVLEDMQRCTYLYSEKLKAMMNELEALLDDVPEKRSMRPLLEYPAAKQAAFKDAMEKVDWVDIFWRGQLKIHEKQLEVAAKTHATWLVDKIGRLLRKAHIKWEKELNKAFKECAK